jgi:hypothetical protein
MRTLLVSAAAVLIAMPSVAAAKAKKPVRQQPQQQIACTVIGCVPVPPGCGQRPGRTWSGSPTGGDVIVCPPGVAPFR